MGFESQRPKGKPIKEWNCVLGGLAAGRGKLKYKKDDRYLPQYVFKSNERLKLFFEVKINLIKLIEKKQYYKSEFVIHI